MKKHLLLFAVLVFASALNIAAQTPEAKMPETEAGKKMQAYLNAFNSGDEAQLKTFLEQNFSEEMLKKASVAQRIENHRLLRKDLGGTLTFERVLVSNDGDIKVLTKAKDNLWLAIAFKFGEAGTRKINSWGIEKVAPEETLKKSVSAIDTKTAEALIGVWEGTAKSQTRGDIPFTMTLKDAPSLTGGIESPVGVLKLLSAEIAAGKFSLVFQAAEGMKLTFSGEIKENKLTGTYDFDGRETGAFDGVKK